METDYNTDIIAIIGALTLRVLKGHVYVNLLTTTTMTNGLTMGLNVFKLICITVEALFQIPNYN